MPVRTFKLTGRDARLHPFHEQSVWNLSRAESATFEAATDPITADLSKTFGTGPIPTFINQDQYSHPIYQAEWSDPKRRWWSTQAGHGARPTEWTPQGGITAVRMPAKAVAALGADGHMHIIHPGGRYIDEGIGVDPDSSSPGDYRFSRHVMVDLHGMGVGPQAGVRAWGGPAVAGLIRAWEIDPNHPQYTGVIKHAVAMALDGSQLYKNPALTGGSTGYSLGGFANSQSTGSVGSTNLGYVWPATEQDFNWYTNYKGQIPMGQYFSIPSDVTLSSLRYNGVGLTASGMMLAKAYQDYGGYVTDQTVGSMVIAYVEPSAPTAWRSEIASRSAADREIIRAALRAVTNNGSTNPNGGPLTGATRRAALLPPVLAP